MNILKKILAALFLAAGLVIGGFSVWLGLSNRDASPVLAAPDPAAQSRITGFLDSICAGDYDLAESLLFGAPSLGMSRPPQDAAGVILWKAMEESRKYSLLGDCYATDRGLAQDVSLEYLDFSSVAEPLGRRAKALLSQAVENAEDISQIYDEQNNYREDLVMRILQDAVVQSIAQDARTVKTTFTINLIFTDGAWWILPEKPMLEAVSGGLLE